MPEVEGGSRREVPAGRLALVLAVGVVWLIVLVVGLQALYYRMEQRALAGKLGGGPPRELRELWQAQQARLEGYRWVDREQGLVAIPIERAMELVMREQSLEAPRGRR